jgi:hypothetical protein
MRKRRRNRHGRMVWLAQAQISEDEWKTILTPFKQWAEAHPTAPAGRDYIETVGKFRSNGNTPLTRLELAGPTIGTLNSILGNGAPFRFSLIGTEHSHRTTATFAVVRIADGVRQGEILGPKPGASGKVPTVDVKRIRFAIGQGWDSFQVTLRQGGASSKLVVHSDTELATLLSAVQTVVGMMGGKLLTPQVPSRPCKTVRKANKAKV